MPTSIMYHEGNRRLQDQFDSRRNSDRIEEKLTRTEFTPSDKSFIESVPYFFFRDSGCRWAARLLLQRRHARLHTRHRTV